MDWEICIKIQQGAEIGVVPFPDHHARAIRVAQGLSDCFQQFSKGSRNPRSILRRAE
jgi:hypothetical protein